MKFTSFIKKLLRFYLLINILFQIIKSINPPCNITHPILKEGKCDSVYCSRKDFNSSKCIINNEIIKTQWLTRIIPISDLNFRYISPVLTKNNDLIIQTSKSTGSPERRFFGIKENGRYYFKDPNEKGYRFDSNGKGYPFYSINVTTEEGIELYKRESISSIIYLENYNNDYFLNIGLNENSYTELIDFKNKNVSTILTSYYYTNSIYSKIGSIFKLTQNNSNNYYFVALITQKNDTFYFLRTLYSFDSTILNADNRITDKVSKVSSGKKMVSCYEDINSTYIFCFYQDKGNYFKIIIYDPISLEDKKAFEIDQAEYLDENIYIFLKSIYLMKNVGFFIYYKSINYKYPFIQIKEWDGDKIIKDYKLYGLINLDGKYEFNYNLHLNDIIKIKENQICYVSTSLDKENIYIVIFNFYDSFSKLKIRYYMIKLYELYNKKIMFELKLTNFGKYISLSSSLCSNSHCNSDDGSFYSYLMIFNYPNSTDANLNLIEHLFNTNETISNININFTKYIKIENNIFGYIYEGIKIIEKSEQITIKSVLNNNEINKDYLFNKNISISISLDGQKTKENYMIKFALILSEPEYNKINDYTIDINDTYADDNEEKYYSREKYIGRTSYFRIIKNYYLSTTCENKECSLCYYLEKNNICVTCNNGYSLIDGKKICFSTSLTISHECSYNDILNNKCNKTIKGEQIGEIYKQIKDNFLYNNYTNENIMILTDNVIFQLSTLEDQKNLDNPLISSIDIGECEDLLKRQENLNEEEELIVMKTDIKSNDSQITYVQYEIYEPRSHKKLNLYICKNISISINTPVIISSDIENLYESLSKSGYNLFNSNDSFYNDICSPYTSENGTDVPMADRQNEIYNNIKNNSMCQNDCQFVFYNSTNKKSKCDCEIQTEETITDINNITFNSQIISSFYNTLKNSNFLVVKCYNLFLSLNGLNGNIGNYILCSFILIFIICAILYFILGNKKIHKFIEEVIQQKNKMEKHLKNNKNKSYNKLKHNKKNLIDNKNIQNNRTQSKKNVNKIKIKDEIKNNKNEPPKLTFKREQSSSNILNINKNVKNKRKINYNNGTIYNNDNSNKIISLKENDIIKKNNKNTKIKNIINNNVVIYNMQIHHENSNKSNNSILFLKQKNKDNNIQFLNDFEMNSLKYKQALKLDKRTYFQYYFSLLKQKHLILFTFYLSNDYNLLSIKISLFILSFSLYFTINAFFFSDETMHKIYINNGEFDIINQIPQILYSSIITSIINVILKYLSLSEKAILSIKKIKELSLCLKISEKIEKCLKIKFILFFISSLLFMIFFWYFISCFCIVYKNTQIILIKDTFLSFFLSMLYPFGINLIPGLFRIPALKNPNKNRQLLYIISGLLALI